MSASLTTDRVVEALQALKSLADYAYEQGYHEMGYDPLQVVRDEIDRLRTANAIWEQTEMRPKL